MHTNSHVPSKAIQKVLQGKTWHEKLAFLQDFKFTLINNPQNPELDPHVLAIIDKDIEYYTRGGR